MERVRGEGGSGAKERHTLSLIFRCALGQPSGKPGWVGIMMALVAWNRRTPGWESGTSPSREMRASEAKSKQQAWLIVRQHTLEARAEGHLTKRGGVWAGQPPAGPDHRSGKNVRSSPPSARKNVIVRDEAIQFGFFILRRVNATGMMHTPIGDCTQAVMSDHDRLRARRLRVRVVATAHWQAAGEPAQRRPQSPAVTSVQGHWRGGRRRPWPLLRPSLAPGRANWRHLWRKKNVCFDLAGKPSTSSSSATPSFSAPKISCAHQTCRKLYSSHSKGTTVLFDSVLDVNSTRRRLELHGLKLSSAAFQRCLDSSAQTKFQIPQVKCQEKFALSRAAVSHRSGQICSIESWGSHAEQF
jgi:hypothetical protein